MKLQVMTASAVAVLLLAASHAQSQPGQRAFTMNAPSISGFPTGDVRLTGGGVYDLASGFVKTGGSFRCNADVNQGPLSGCRAGDGVRWDAEQLLPTTTFKCTGSASEALKTANTDNDTVVILADFYRAGDGTHESFQARMIVSGHDLDPDLPGIQNVWVQGVGCGQANTRF
jgi:hypothetical protein